MPRKPTNFKPSGGREPVNFQAALDPNMPITNRVGAYFEPKIIEDDDEMIETAPSGVLNAKMGIPRMPKPMSAEEAIRLASTAATFGQQPRISALTESLISEKPYDQALSENQEMLEYIRRKHPVASKAIEIPVSLAATAPLQGATLLGRLGIGAGIGAGYGSEQQDLATSEGWVNTGVGAGIGAGASVIPNAAKAGSDFVKQRVADASEGGTTVKNLIRDYIVKKNKPEIVETLVNKPNTISDLANVGSAKARETLGKAIAPFREEAFSTTTNKLQTPEAIRILEELNPPISQNAPAKLNYIKETPTSSADEYLQTIVEPESIMKQTGSAENQLPVGADKFLNDIQARLQKPKSSADVLRIVDDLDDEAKKFYKQVTKGEKRNLTKSENRYYSSLVETRNSLKEKLRSPDSEWGGADKMYNQLEKDMPAVKALEQAKLDYAKKSAQADFPKLTTQQGANLPYPTKPGVLSKVLDFVLPDGGLEYTDQISEDIANKLVDPDVLMQLIQQGDKEIIPNVRPTGILKALETLGYLDRNIGGVSTYNALANELASQSPKLLNEE